MTEFTSQSTTINTAHIFIFPRTYAQFVVTLRIDERIPVGVVGLSQVQLVNLELCIDEYEVWSLYEAKDPIALSGETGLLRGSFHRERLEN